MPGLEIRTVRSLLGRRLFVDVPFRIHGGDPGWIPPLRLTVYDRLSPRHPAMRHQEVALWLAYRQGRPVGRIGACIDTAFNDYQNVRWGWVGFFDSFDDPAVAGALFDAACAWAADRGADLCVGPACFTTNDELGLQVDGFDDPPALLTLQNPRYYETLWVEHGWEPAMDLWAWHFDSRTTALSDRQRRTLDRIQQRAQVTVRSIRMDEFDAEVGRFFEVYNAAWSDNWGFAPMPEAEIRHLAGQLKQIINPNWAFGLETPEGQVVGVCLALPDVNRLMRRVRSGRLFPFGLVPAAHGPQAGPARPGSGPSASAPSTSTWPSAPCCTARSWTVWRPTACVDRRGVLDPRHQPPHQRPAGRHGRPPLEGVAPLPAAGRQA